MIETFDVKPSDLTIAVSNFSPSQGYPDGGGSSFRIGWRNVDLPEYAYYYNAFFTLDFSEFQERRVTQNNFVSAEFRISEVSGSHGLTSSLYRVLRNITSSLDWKTYNGINNWSIAGGSGSGSDRLANSYGEFSADTTYTLPLDVSTLFAIYNDNWKFGIYTTSPRPVSNNYENLTYNNTLIRVSYHRFGMSGDAILF